MSVKVPPMSTPICMRVRPAPPRRREAGAGSGGGYAFFRTTFLK